ncbi:MAG: NYN domain-containing protein [Phycisphaerales bacterium]
MLLIDTYNVLHTPGVLPLGLAGLDVDGLCRLVTASRYASREITLVCDGHGKDTRRGTMHVVFAADSGDADSWIESRLAHDSAPRRILVVSSDRRIRRAADKAGAAVLSSATFLAQLAIDLDRKRPKPRPRFATDLPLDALSVAYWAGQFGLSREEMTRLDEESHAITPGGRERGTDEAPRKADVKARESGAGNGDSGKAKAGGVPKSPAAGSETRAAPALGAGLPPPAFDAKALADDPVIRSALEHWSGRLSLDDLDMSRWIDHPSGASSIDAESNRSPGSETRSKEKA